MHRSLKWIATALGAVLLILISARSLGGQSLVPESWRVSLLAAEVLPETLTVTDQPIQNLPIGNVVEVHRFTLEGAPYSLRYLTFAIEIQDLEVEDVRDWTVYEVEDGLIDYQSKVAQGEAFADGLLKLRFFSDRSRAYLGEGRQEFALVTNLSRTGEVPSLHIQKTDSETLPTFYQWAWVEGHMEEAWGGF